MIPFVISLFISIIACVSIICRFQDIVLRTGLVIIVVTASLISFWLITLYAGKPLESYSPPDDFIVYGHAIDLQGKKMYILYRKPNADFPPILIELPYEKNLGKALRDGAKKSEGKPFRLKKGENQGEGGQGEGEGEGENEGEGEGSLSLESESWDLMPLPSPILPPKNTLKISKDMP